MAMRKLFLESLGINLSLFQVLQHMYVINKTTWDIAVSTDTCDSKYCIIGALRFVLRFLFFERGAEW